MKSDFVVLLFVGLFFSLDTFAQDVSGGELPFEVNRVLPPFHSSQKALAQAQTLNDLNPHYPSTWVRQYLSVKVATLQQGAEMQAFGKSNTLNQKQIDLIANADLGADISILVEYIPENSLLFNETKQIDFVVSIDPAKEATFVGGDAALRAYLWENAISTIPEGTFIKYDLAIIKFTIDEAGRIANPHVFSAFKLKEIDELLLNAICNMPDWNPATYADGTRTAQDFVLTIGNMGNCKVNLLNIR